MKPISTPLRTHSEVSETRFPYYPKFSSVQLDKTRVIRAREPKEWDRVKVLRASGFSRYPGFQEGSVDWIDELDNSDNAFSLLAGDPDGEWVATMRIQDGRNSRLEVSKYINLESLLVGDYFPAAQFSRLSVLKHSSSVNAMAGLFKAGYIWCLRNKIASIICATPRWSYPIYQSMSFISLGPRGEFVHSFGSPTPHKTLLLPVKEAPSLWRRDTNPMFSQFVELDHPDLIV